MGVKIRTAAHEVLASSDFVCGMSCTVTVPAPNAANGAPLPGTRGVEGLAAEIVVSTGFFNWFGTPPATYTLTLTMVGRDGYNEGGIELCDAPEIGIGVSQYGSVYPAEPGQFYRVHLLHDQLIYVEGQATASTTWGANFTIVLLNSAGADVATLANVPAYGMKEFPAAGANPVTYVNTGPDADFYLRAKSGAWMTADFRFQVQTPRLIADPASVTRGQTATFRVLGARGATATSWQFTSESYSPVTRTTAVSSLTWPGTVVVSGVGHATITIAGRSITLNPAALQVTPRADWAWSPRPATKVAWGTPAPGNALTPPNPPDGSGFVGGGYWLLLSSSGAGTHKIDDNGPNHGFVYTVDKITDSNSSAASHFWWAVSPDGENPNSEFYQKQYGSADPITMTGCISGSNLLAGINRHEAGSSNSHYANYVSSLNVSDNNPGSFAESFIGGPTLTEEQYNTDLSTGISNRKLRISTASDIEPSPVNFSVTGQWLGDINFAPSYASCAPDEV